MSISPRVLVTEFHDSFKCPIRNSPMSDSEFKEWDRAKLRLDLIEEEAQELVDAYTANDVVEVADALGDMIYVIYGMAIEMGVNLDDVVAEIHRSNMSKLGPGGKPLYREDGKVLKGPNYTRPDIRKVIYG